ncbi:MAG: hypothetical protein AAF623_21110 [Planctomycetota bacterium]
MLSFSFRRACIDEFSTLNLSVRSTRYYYFLDPRMRVTEEQVTLNSTELSTFLTQNSFLPNGFEEQFVIFQFIDGRSVFRNGIPTFFWRELTEFDWISWSKERPAFAQLFWDTLLRAIQNGDGDFSYAILLIDSLKQNPQLNAVQLAEIVQSMGEKLTPIGGETKIGGQANRP